MSPAPYLHRESVSFTDVVTIAGGPSGGVSYAQLGPNGVDAITTNQVVPQGALWDQYAAMYEFYQVKHIAFKFVPYRY